MTTSTEVLRESLVEEIRVVMSHPTASGERIGLGAVVHRCESLRSFVSFANHLTVLRARDSKLGWLNLRGEVEVSKISFNSPFEIVILVTTSVGAATTTGAAMIHLFNLFQGARVERAQADFHVEALHLLTEQLREAAAGQPGTARSDQRHLIAGAAKDVSKAADALFLMDDVQVLSTEPEPPILPL